MQKLPLKHRLLTKFLLSFVSLVLITIFAVGFYLISKAEGFIQESVERRHLDVAKMSSYQIQFFMENAIEIVKTTQEISDLSKMQQLPVRTIINKMKRRKDYFKRVFGNLVGMFCSVLKFKYPYPDRK